MRPDQEADFSLLLTDVLAYYRQNVSPFTLSVWLQACQSFEFEQVSAALTAHAMDPERGVFAPKVADIIRVLSGTKTDRAMLAWGKVHEAMGRVGAYTDVVFDDAAIHAAVDDLGGWPKVCRTKVEELSYLQHRFCEAHKAYTGRGQFDYPRRLTGDRSPDEEFAKRGLPPPRPAVIGSRDVAAMVYQGGTTGGRLSVQSMTLEALAGPSAARLQTLQQIAA